MKSLGSAILCPTSPSPKVPRIHCFCAEHIPRRAYTASAPRPSGRSARRRSRPRSKRPPRRWRRCRARTRVGSGICYHSFKKEFFSNVFANYQHEQCSDIVCRLLSMTHGTGVALKPTLTIDCFLGDETDLFEARKMCTIQLIRHSCFSQIFEVFEFDAELYSCLDAQMSTWTKSPTPPSRRSSVVDIFDFAFHRLPASPQ